MTAIAFALPGLLLLLLLAAGVRTGCARFTRPPKPKEAPK